MPVKSLVELATGVCLKNLRGVDSVGDYLPYEAVRHILLKVESAYQLRQIELNSPQIQGETGEIWLKLIEKDFPLEYRAKAYKPPSADKWYRVWEKYKKDHDKALHESEDKLKNALAGLKQAKEKNTSKIIERKFLPRSARPRVKKILGGPREAQSNTLTFNAGSRTKTINGASVMRKVRREVKEIASIHGALSRQIRGPTRVNQIQKAPASMVNDYRRATQPKFRSSTNQTEPSTLVLEHEEKASFISDSEDDSPRGDEGEASMPKAASKPAKRTVAQSAATSLLKRKPAQAVVRSTPTATDSPSKGSTSTPAPKMRVIPATSSSQDKTASGGLAGKFKASARSTSATKSAAQSNSAAASRAPAKSHYLPQTQTSPPLAASAGPSSPPPIDPLPQAGAPDASTRKRKAVDIFMRRPKKRVG